MSSTPIYRLGEDERARRAVEHRGEVVTLAFSPQRRDDDVREVTGRLISVAYASLGAGTMLAIVRHRKGNGALVDSAFSLAQVVSIERAQ